VAKPVSNASAGGGGDEGSGDGALEILRSQSGLAIDREGRFLHRGEPITHERTLAVLWSSLGRSGDGRWRVSVGRESAYVEVADLPWTVLGVLLGDGAAPVLVLPAGLREPLDPTTLTIGADGVLRCRVRGDHPARFSRAAQVALGLALEEDPAGSGQYHLTVGKDRFAIRPG
jgi:hypothetical protein